MTKSDKYAKEPKELAVDLNVWKVELEKQIACMETNETKMMERADQEALPAEPVGPYPSVNHGTGGCDYIAKRGNNDGGTSDYIHVRSHHFVASSGHDGHR